MWIYRYLLLGVAVFDFTTIAATVKADEREPIINISANKFDFLRA